MRKSLKLVPASYLARSCSDSYTKYFNLIREATRMYSYNRGDYDCKSEYWMHFSIEVIATINIKQEPTRIKEVLMQNLPLEFTKDCKVSAQNHSKGWEDVAYPVHFANK